MLRRSYRVRQEAAWRAMRPDRKFSLSGTVHKTPSVINHAMCLSALEPWLLHCVYLHTPPSAHTHNIIGIQIYTIIILIFIILVLVYSSWLLNVVVAINNRQFNPGRTCHGNWTVELTKSKWMEVQHGKTSSLLNKFLLYTFSKSHLISNLSTKNCKWMWN